MSAIKPVTPGITIPALIPPITLDNINTENWPTANINSDTENKINPIHIINFFPNLSASVPPNGDIII